MKAEIGIALYTTNKRNDVLMFANTKQKRLRPDNIINQKTESLYETRPETTY